MNDIVSGLHSCADVRDALKKLLEQLKRIIDHDISDIYVFTVDGRNIHFDEFISCGLSENDCKMYMKDQYEMDDTLSIIASQRPVMIRTSDIFDMDERRKTEYYSHCIGKHDIGYSLEANFETGSGDRYGGISLHRFQGKEDFDYDDIEMLEFLRPHISAAFHKMDANEKKKLNICDEIALISSIDNVSVYLFDIDYDLIEVRNPIVSGEDSCLDTILTIIKNEVISGNLHSADPDGKICEVRKAVEIMSSPYYMELTVIADTQERPGTVILYLYDFNGIVMDALKSDDVKDMMTKKESEVLARVLDGMSNREIGYEMNISESTVKTHLNNICYKLGISCKSQVFASILKLI